MKAICEFSRLSQSLGLAFYGQELPEQSEILDTLDLDGATTLLLHGGTQDPWSLTVAKWAVKRGLRCVLIAIEPFPTRLTGNLLPLRLLETEVVLQPPDGRPLERLQAEAEAHVRRRYVARGERVFLLPRAEEILQEQYRRGCQTILRYCEQRGITKGTLLLSQGQETVVPLLEGTAFALWTGETELTEKACLRGLTAFARQTGILLPPEHDGRLFSAFYQAEHPDPRETVFFLYQQEASFALTEEQETLYFRELVGGLTDLPKTLQQLAPFLP